MSTTQETTEKRSSSAGKVPHFTGGTCGPREGGARRGDAPLAWRMGAAETPTGPGRPARGAGGDARAGARPDPVRADARLAVHVLPRRRLPDGLRPVGTARAPACTRSSAATRTCRTSASTPRPTGGSSSASTTSTRRCPGPFEWDVKRLVASFAVAGRDRGFDAKPRGQDQHRGLARVPRSDGGLRRDAEPGHLVRAASTSSELVASFAARGQRRAERSGWRRNLAKTRTKDSLQAFDKLTEIVDGEPRIVERPAADRPDRRARSGDRRRRAARQRSAADPRLPAHARRRPPQAARAVPATSTRAQGRRRRQRRHARVDRADARPRRRGPAVPAGQGGAGLGARAVPRQERVRQPRPARRRGPAADAGRERHLARLDPHRRASTASRARLLRPPALGREGLGASSS